MDPTLAALLGAGIGAIVTALSPWMTGRMQHAARRREVMREAYLEGMRVVAYFPRVESVGDIEKLKAQLFEARLHIRFVGSWRAFAKFQKLADVMDEWADTGVQAAKKPHRGKTAEQILAEAIPPENQIAAGVAHEAFVEAARRDMGMEDRLLFRLARLFRRRTKPAEITGVAEDT